MVGFTGGVLSITVTETVKGFPTQPFAVGVMVKVVVCGFFGSVLVNVPKMVLPEPLAGMEPPIIVVLLRVQVNVVPGIPFGFVIVMFAMAAPGQMVCVNGVAETLGNRFTIIVPVALVCTQFPDVVTVKLNVPVLVGVPLMVNCFVAAM